MNSGEVNLLMVETQRLVRVAEYIYPYPPETDCGWNGSVLIFTVTATVGEESEQRIYNVRPRSEL